MRLISLIAIAVVCFHFLRERASAEPPAAVFSSQVAPLLQRRCFSCHNDRDRKGEFSLETWQDVDASGFVIAGDTAASYLLEVVTPQGGKRPAMPKESDPLTEAEVASLRQWIAAGAPWPEGYRLQEARVTDFAWWSWRKLERPQPPPVDESERAWARTPIDAFVLARLRQSGLSPSPEADRRTLVRRMYFDLIGLPPTPEEVAAFRDDPDPLAYEKLVDRLLDSPRYGERWARHWLDVVHYGDTHGYDKDKPRPNAWPYRDYVIRAFNEDKPYGRFVREQIAGDVLWPETIDGNVAPGFLAAGPWDFIGHAEVPETKYDGKVARNLDRDDMATTTLNAFCSLTIQCARCHNHKLDAVSMVDYYRTQAVFAAIDRADRPFDADPAVARRRGELVQRKDQLASELAAVEQQIAAKKTPDLAELEKSIAELEAKLSATAAGGEPHSPAYGYHSDVASRQDDAKWVQVDLGASVPIDRVLLFGADEYGWADFGFPHRFRVETADDADFTTAAALADFTAADYSRPGAAPVLLESHGMTGRYLRITATKLWSRRQKDAALTNDWIFAVGEMAVVSDGKLVPVQSVAAKDSIEAAPRWGRQNLIDGIGGRTKLPTDVESLLALARPNELQAQLVALIEQRKQREIEVAGAELIARREQVIHALDEAKNELAALPAPQLVYAGTVHKGDGAFRGRSGLGPREIHVLLRGDVNKPDQVVGPGTLPLVPGISAEFDLPANADEGERRAALAEWIAHRDNPLTWRSIVNRVWLYHFGRGLVDTPNDFGHGGQLPSHPELLDWLAVEFRDGGQALKSLHRLICTSAVYRQTAAVDTAPRDVDPQATDADNKLLWRANRRRLTAEEIRDAALAVSGKLDLTMGGPGFADFVVEHPEHSPHYEYGLYDPHDPRTHRRAVYRFIVRSQPQPFMDTLDCADPSSSVPKREETLTSLQALAMLNNRFMIASAQHFAERLTRERETLPEQLTFGFQLTTGRAPEAEELEALSTYSQEFGLANACRVLLNASEFVFVD